MAKLTVKLVKSTIGCKQDQIATVAALGLRKRFITILLKSEEWLRKFHIL